jgi:metallophosphoesterase (TIGR03767 family)
VRELEHAPYSSELTTVSTLRRGDMAVAGTESGYYRLASGPGEPHQRRLDLAPAARSHGQRTSLLHFALVTDLHVLDPGSPGRFEFVERLHGPEALHLLLPSYRPHEFLQVHAVEAMVRTVGSITESPLTGASVDFALLTGDITDNVQRDELQQALSLLAGGTVAPYPSGSSDWGVISDGWDDACYWHPGELDDVYKQRWGFPRWAGLLESASRPFHSGGLSLPWLSCYGNHDGLVLGGAIPTPAYERIVAGSEKPTRFPAGFDPLYHLNLFIAQPELFLAGPSTAIAANPARRSYTRHEFVQAHLGTAGEPAGHGFTARNASAGTTYYAADRDPHLRLIVLDTVNLAGDYQGSIGARQFAWLEERLIEVHSRYRDVHGDGITTGNQDRLVVVCSHHGLPALINDRRDPERENDLPRILGPQVEALLHRFPNVILWVNGHIHRNVVHPRPDSEGRGAGFWEVTTASLIDWPCQGRLVEIVANGDGTLSIVCTMVDHAAPPDPREASGVWRLAALHRELAANDPHAGIKSGRSGRPEDRNVELVLPAPFPIS